VAALLLDFAENGVARNLLQLRQVMMRFLLWAAMLGLTACGGKYIEPGSDGSGESGSASDPTISATAGSSGGSGAAKGGSYANPALPQHDLGVCSPGFDHAANPTQACPWLTEAGQCFATNDDACACACPTDHDSVCFSSFDGPGATTLVHCD
jgi:hypothetical protein